MELASEDLLRLNILMANRPLAIRLDEGTLTLWGLMATGEAKVSLHPPAKPAPYCKQVREYLSGQVLGSPGGYPVFLRRWTRMGQMRDESLAQLLLLGEPEAVVAAASAPGLTDELARRVWWCWQDADIARHMLTRPAVAAGSMGLVLADYLVQHLPFDANPEAAAESVRLVLQPGLLDQAVGQGLWRKAAQRTAYLVGFLGAAPPAWPVLPPPRPDWQPLVRELGPLADQGNPPARLLLDWAQPEGQAYLGALDQILARPPSLDLLARTLDLLRERLGAARPEGNPDLPLPDLAQDAEHHCGPAAPSDWSACLAAAPDRRGDLMALRVLSGLGYGVLRPLIRDTSVSGALLRRKLMPVTECLRGHVRVLLGGTDSARPA